ncbi:slyX [Halomonas sp. 1513]|nr:SlyX family protein [Halomonas sp. 1513]APX91847.1 slyX [Halomonas sp. 1513]
MPEQASLAGLAARLEALESRTAHQEHWLDQLDEAVASQERRLQELIRLNAMMQKRLREQQQALNDQPEGFDPSQELPPHY